MGVPNNLKFFYKKGVIPHIPIIPARKARDVAVQFPAKLASSIRKHQAGGRF